MVIELITHLRQAEKYAARYRWLHESASTENHGGFAYDFRLVDAIRYMPGAAPNETMDIDAAIDEATVQMVRFGCGDNDMRYGLCSKQSPIFNRRPPQPKMAIQPNWILTVGIDYKDGR